MRGTVAKRLRNAAFQAADGVVNALASPRKMLTKRYGILKSDGNTQRFPYTGTIRYVKYCPRWHYKKLKRWHRNGGDVNSLFDMRNA